MTLPVPLWVTRGTRGGELQAHVEAWNCRPERLRVAESGDVFWLASVDDWLDGGGGLVAQWTLEECRAEVGTVPDTDREVLVRGTPDDLAEYDRRRAERNRTRADVATATS